MNVDFLITRRSGFGRLLRKLTTGSSARFDGIPDDIQNAYTFECDSAAIVRQFQNPMLHAALRRHLRGDCKVVTGKGCLFINRTAATYYEGPLSAKPKENLRRVAAQTISILSEIANAFDESAT